ncbi:hypothetical protein DPMN_093994 [Dreissena polymorpha]|uniref:Uncharacterized protein n=1 Tax=Dreissena polymorpha TaxID=45954 RepID=A0A9D4L3Z0_DREPO|nr:hypothetical protein DPMN_093994 [Dreissena polymorpha]
MLWTISSISFLCKYRLYKSVIISHLLYGFKICTLHADTERRIQAFEHKCHHSLLLLHGAQDQRVRPEHDSSTCWLTGTAVVDRQTTKAYLVSTRHQTRIAVQGCFPGSARSRSPLKPSEKMDVQCERVGVPPLG